jgi:hypothetical protein
VAGLAAGAELDTNALPPAASMKVDFDRDIRPILEQSCLRCHGPEKPKSHFRLTGRQAALKGGDNNPDDIVPGNSAGSHLIQYVAGLVPDMQMPPSGKAEPLTPVQIGRLRAWIDQGATWSTTNQPPQLAFSISPALRGVTVAGDKAKFRELEGIKEGAGGGVEHFSLTEQGAPDRKFSAEGHFLFPDQDLQLKLRGTKMDVGFVSAGFDHWRKYYDGHGGFAPSLPTNSFNLDRDLHLDLGRAWFDIGLTLPNWPQIVVGYEYRFKEGDEATLQWGAVGTNAAALSPDSKKVYPAAKHIDEHAHVFKLEVSDELAGWKLEDNARVEFYRLETSRHNVLADSFGPAPEAVANVAEKDKHAQGANTLSARKQLTGWLSVASGYFYSRLDGNAGLTLRTDDSTGLYFQDYQWSADDITLKRESHVVSLSGLAGPWEGLTLAGGVQGEWTRQDSMGLVNLQSPSLPSGINGASGSLDTDSVRENLGLRYTAIPYTVLFADARLLQQSLRRFDEGYLQSFTSFGLFTNRTDADIESEEYRVGFNTSPWARLSLGASFKHSDARTHYNGTNTLFGNYPGFIQWRDIDENQVEARVVYRAAAWLRTSFDFRWRKTDFDSATIVIPGFTGGPVEAGDETTHAYSFNAVLTPVRRLYLSGTFSYSDSRIATAFDGQDGLVPWEGGVYSVLSSATYALNPRTDLRAAYLYSAAGYGQHNQAGLPAGIDYDRHSLQLGVTHRFGHQLVTGLQYGFYRYREPTLGGANDYTAHGIFATATLPWP